MKRHIIFIWHNIYTKEASMIWQKIIYFFKSALAYRKDFPTNNYNIEFLFEQYLSLDDDNHLSIEFLILSQKIDTEFSQSNQVLQFAWWRNNNFADHILFNVKIKINISSTYWAFKRHIQETILIHFLCNVILYLPWGLARSAETERIKYIDWCSLQTFNSRLFW